MIVTSLKEAEAKAEELGLPVVVKPEGYDYPKFTIGRMDQLPNAFRTCLVKAPVEMVKDELH